MNTSGITVLTPWILLNLLPKDTLCQDFELMIRPGI